MKNISLEKMGGSSKCQGNDFYNRWNFYGLFSQPRDVLMAYFAFPCSLLSRDFLSLHVFPKVELIPYWLFWGVAVGIGFWGWLRYRSSQRAKQQLEQLLEEQAVELKELQEELQSVPKPLTLDSEEQVSRETALEDESNLLLVGHQVENECDCINSQSLKSSISQSRYKSQQTLHSELSDSIPLTGKIADTSLSIYGEEDKRCFQTQASSLQGELLVTGHWSLVTEMISSKHLYSNRESQQNYSLYQQSAIAQLGQRGLSGIDIYTLMDEAVKLLAKILDLQYCSILEILPNETTLLLRSGVGWSEGLVGFATMSLSGNSQAGYTLKKNQAVIVHDLPLETRFRSCPLLHNHHIKSGATVVIPTRKKAFGVLGVYSQDKRVFDKDEVDFLGAIANILSATIERQSSEEQLHLLERAINASSNGIVITDAVAIDNPVIYVNDSFSRLTGYASEEVLGKNCRLLQGNDIQQPELKNLRVAIQEGRECHAILRNYRKDGTLFWNELHIAPVHNSEGHLTHFIGVQTDITERKWSEEALKKSEEQFRLTFNLAPIGMVISSLEGDFLQVNRALCEALGYSQGELLQRSFVDITYPDDLATDLTLYQKLAQGKINEFQSEKRYLAKGGEIIHAILQVVLVRDAQNSPLHLIGQFVNITDRKQMEEQLVHDAFHDVLTGLPNRALFKDRLGQALQRKKRNPHDLFAVLFLDLDRFKVINDSLGHLVGDELLIAIAQKLSDCIRVTDTVARLGGDEFTILLENITETQDAIYFAKRILDELKSPFYIEGHEIFSQSSIGIALSSLEYEDPEDILRDADIAMYRAKELGKGRYEVFDQKLHDRALMRLQLEHDLQRALLGQEFQLYYQPIVTLNTGKITGFEALLRWQHSTQGLVSPSQFISIAEEMGLIVPIGEWVLREACLQLKQWQHQFPSSKDLTISVNLSPKQLQEANLTQRVEKILQETALESRNLKFEITESTILDNSKITANILSQFRKQNIGLCIDDFGTGYSSLSYLHRFPVNTLKIDRSFVSPMQQDDENFEIVSTIITLAHALGMNVIAEGIEHQEQLNQLKLLGCEQGQGYLFSQPVTSERAETLIKNGMILSK